MSVPRMTLEQLIRFRSLVLRAIVEYLDSTDWLEVTSSTLTSLTGACETISTVFKLAYFDRLAHLSQTAQLQLEMLTKELKTKVWTIDHSFRAEPRVTGRHLTEFTLIELECRGMRCGTSWLPRRRYFSTASGAAARAGETSRAGAGPLGLPRGPPLPLTSAGIHGGHRHTQCSRIRPGMG